MKTRDDIDLLRCITQNDERAFKQVFEKYYSMVFYMMKQCSSAEDAKDLAQEVFVKLWNNRSRLEDVNSLKAYLFTISKNSIIDYLRKNINRLIFEKLDEDIFISQKNIESENDSKETLDQIYALANEMPERQLEAFNLRWIKGLSRKEVAEKMNISIVTVDIHLGKARKFIQERIE